jgi:hypothetical protein
MENLYNGIKTLILSKYKITPKQFNKFLIEEINKIIDKASIIFEDKTDEILKDNFKLSWYNELTAPYKYRRIEKELGILPNRYMLNISGNNFTFIPYLYNDNQSFNKTIIDKLNKITDDYILKRVDFYKKSGFPDVEIKDRILKLKENARILMNDIKSSKAWIPCGYINGRLFLTSIEIDRFDATILPRGGGNMILCILYELLKKLTNTHSATVTLSTHDTGNHEAYKKMGFENYSKEGTDHNRILNIEIFKKNCNTKFKEHMSNIKYYYRKT